MARPADQIDLVVLGARDQDPGEGGRAAAGQAEEAPQPVDRADLLEDLARAAVDLLSELVDLPLPEPDGALEDLGGDHGDELSRPPARLAGLDGAVAGGLVEGGDEVRRRVQREAERDRDAARRREGGIVAQRQLEGARDLLGDLGEVLVERFALARIGQLGSTLEFADEAREQIPLSLAPGLRQGERLRLSLRRVTNHPGGLGAEDRVALSGCDRSCRSCARRCGYLVSTAEGSLALGGRAVGPRYRTRRAREQQRRSRGRPVRGGPRPRRRFLRRLRLRRLRPKGPRPKRSRPKRPRPKRPHPKRPRLKGSGPKEPGPKEPGPNEPGPNEPPPNGLRPRRSSSTAAPSSAPRDVVIARIALPRLRPDPRPGAIGSSSSTIRVGRARSCSTTTAGSTSAGGGLSGREMAPLKGTRVRPYFLCLVQPTACVDAGSWYPRRPPLASESRIGSRARPRTPSPPSTTGWPIAPLATKLEALPDRLGALWRDGRTAAARRGSRSRPTASGARRCMRSGTPGPRPSGARSSATIVGAFVRAVVQPSDHPLPRPGTRRPRPRSAIARSLPVDAGSRPPVRSRPLAPTPTPHLPFDTVACGQVVLTLFLARWPTGGVRSVSDGRAAAERHPYNHGRFGVRGRFQPHRLSGGLNVTGRRRRPRARARRGRSAPCGRGCRGRPRSGSRSGCCLPPDRRWGRGGPRTSRPGTRPPSRR